MQPSLNWYSYSLPGQCYSFSAQTAPSASRQMHQITVWGPSCYKMFPQINGNLWSFGPKNSILPRKTIIQQRKRPALSFMRSSIGVTYYLDNSFQSSPITGPACIFRASHQNN
eukprot:scaffold313_cov378-Pavlova_lutheri.AAC.6